MKLELIRDIFTDTFTLGKLNVNGEFFAYTVEDEVRNVFYILYSVLFHYIVYEFMDKETDIQREPFRRNNS